MQLLEIKSAMRAVTLTDTAVSKVRELVQAEGDPSLVLRFGVRPGGCSGFSYEMYFDTQIDDGDIVETFDDDVRVVIDSESLRMVRGSTIDYKSDLMSAGFAINNPNITSSCGCGNSFS
jgi:iron-sulfur cluster assembly accessory protein